MRHLTPQEAHTFLKQRPAAVLIDCRSEIEHLFIGYPPEAVHIPWQDSQDWEVNPEFHAQVRQVVSVHHPVVLICRCGRRSVEAGAFLEQQGFFEVYDVKHGFEGDLDEACHRGNKNGWRHDGLPWVQI